MRTQHTIPMLRVACEDCDWRLPREGWSEHVESNRATAIAHARRRGHRVFAEKNTGSLYVGHPFGPPDQDHREARRRILREPSSSP